MDCYARAGASVSFHSYFRLGEDVVEVFNEKNASRASDTLVAKLHNSCSTIVVLVSISFLGWCGGITLLLGAVACYIQSSNRWAPALRLWKLKQFDVDTRVSGRTALFGCERLRQDKIAHQQVTRALLDAGADPRLLVGGDELPPLAVLEEVFECVLPQTLFPSAADLLSCGP
jgi:hypothetical protein